MAGVEAEAAAEVNVLEVKAAVGAAVEVSVLKVKAAVEVVRSCLGCALLSKVVCVGAFVQDKRRADPTVLAPITITMITVQSMMLLHQRKKI